MTAGYRFWRNFTLLPGMPSRRFFLLDMPGKIAAAEKAEGGYFAAVGNGIGRCRKFYGGPKPTKQRAT